MSASISFDIHFVSGKSSHRVIRKGKRPKHARPLRLPRVTRLMALSIKYEHLICKGFVQNHDELAELAGVDRSLISRVLRLRQLSPEIQEWLLNLPEQEPGNDPVDWTDMHPISRISSWEKQRQALDQLLNSKGLTPLQANGLACGAGTKKWPKEQGERK